MTVIEKILAAHSTRERLKPGDLIDVFIDARVARDFGGANVVKHMDEHALTLADPERTFFTFDCNPTGSDQKYAANQQRCRQYARREGVRVYDIDQGIGTHVLIEDGLAFPGSTAVSTDSHANVLGAVGAFGQGMGDKDIAAAWHKGSIWFKVPPSDKIVLEGSRPKGVTAKDIVLNLLSVFGASSLLGKAVELEGELVDRCTLDERITIASMATEMGAIALLFPPSAEVLHYCESRSGRKIAPVVADPDAEYAAVHHIDVSGFVPRISHPGKPHDTSALPAERIWIDSAFIGSCTNGRIEDMRAVAAVLEGKHVAPGVVLKIVPATDRVWQQCLNEGLVSRFKRAGALLSNAGCAGCAAGQVGQNGPGEVTISTGNRNFPGKQGQGRVYLASPVVVAASALAGYIVDPKALPADPPERPVEEFRRNAEKSASNPVTDSCNGATADRPETLRGRVWVIERDNIDTDMIFHNRYLSITKVEEMGPCTFDNLEGYEDFSSRVESGDIVVAGKNFGSGSSRQQAVDCFVALGVQCVVAESFGAIYERNAINAAFPIMEARDVEALALETGDELEIDLHSGAMKNLSRGGQGMARPFSEVQMDIYKRGGLF